MLMQQTAIEIQQLSKQYKSRDKQVIQAVKDLNLSIPAGQVFGFLGANGAGKTTTIKMICSLIKPDTGTIKVNGYDVQKERSQALKGIGAVLEGTRNVYWRLTALENILYFGRLKGGDNKVLKARAEMLLQDLELWERRNDKIRTFSRGMQQKVAIACALIHDPAIVLLDEPTLGLDVKAALTVKRWIGKLAAEHHKTIILTTHQLDIAQDLCEQIAIINKGTVLTNQPKRDLLNLFRNEYYEIRVRGQVSSAQLNGAAHRLSITTEEENSILVGAIDNQDDLFHLLQQIKDLKLPLLSVKQSEPNLEDIFINYLEGTN